MAIIPTPPLSLKEAIARSADVYDVWVNEWGTRIANNPPTFLRDDSYPDYGQPGIPDSIAGVAIGPESHVDRCWITVNSSKDFRLVQDTLLYTREVSVEQPLFFTQPAKVGPPLSTFDDGIAPLPQHAQAQNLFYVFADIKRPGVDITSTQLPPTYLKADFTSADINQPLPALNTRRVGPRLQLRFLLREGVFVPNKRAPVLWGSVNNETVGVDAGVETAIFKYPIYGRKRIAIQMRGDNTGGVNDTFRFRIAVLRTINYDQIVQEETVGDKTITCDANGRAGTSFRICDPAAAYLILYATSTVNGQVTGWSVQAED